MRGWVWVTATWQIVLALAMAKAAHPTSYGKLARTSSCFVDV